MGVLWPPKLPRQNLVRACQLASNVTMLPRRDFHMLDGDRMGILLGIMVS